MGSALLGSRQVLNNVLLTGILLGTPVNLLVSSQKCQGVPFSPICQKSLLIFAAAPLALIPFVRNQGALSVNSFTRVGSPPPASGASHVGPAPSPRTRDRSLSTNVKTIFKQLYVLALLVNFVSFGGIFDIWPVVAHSLGDNFH